VTRRVSPPASVRVAIDRITLHGYSPAQRARFVASLQASLRALDATGSAPRGGQSLGRLDAGALPTGATPEEAAERVGAAIRAALARGAIGALGS
jgi:hypothetical protein